jgi:hypothetical protein
MRTSGHTSETGRACVRSCVAALSGFAAALTWDRVPAGVREHARLAVVDLLGVGVAGAATAEHQRLPGRPPAGGDPRGGVVLDPTRLALALLGAGHRAGLPPVGA